MPRRRRPPSVCTRRPRRNRRTRADAVGRGLAVAHARGLVPLAPLRPRGDVGDARPHHLDRRRRDRRRRDVVPAHIDNDARPATITTNPSTMKPNVRPTGACASSRFCRRLRRRAHRAPRAAALDRARRDAVGVAVTAQERVEVAEEQAPRPWPRSARGGPRRRSCRQRRARRHRTARRASGLRDRRLPHHEEEDDDHREVEDRVRRRPSSSRAAPSPRPAAADHPPAAVRRPSRA